MLSVNQINAQIKLTETWKALNSEANEHNLIQSMKLVKPTGARSSRAMSNGNLKETGVSTLAKSTFINDSTRLWNRAPNVIKNCTSLYSAKKEIKKFVKTLPI